MSENSTKVVIIGSGLSGLMTAFELALLKQQTVVISKGPLIQTNTWMAQGGVAAAVSHTDSIESHLKDTLKAGDGLCVKKNVEKILSAGPLLIEKIISAGMRFDQNGLDVSLGREGGHQERRILHVDDQTGRALHEFIFHKLTQDPDLSPFCSFLENTMVQSSEKNEQSFHLQTLNIESRETYKITCSHLVLATGGAGKSFLYTSNWEGATGDGFKMAHDLGAKLKNLEMIQFHPTCLFHRAERNFLISEALRGEGAKLFNEKKERFAFDFHKDGELAPRDVVSRAIEHEIKSSGKDCVHLDISHKSTAYLKKRFPTIFKRCLELGFDLSKGPIPVVPAAHYTCGGINTKENLVSTDVKNLFVVGECGYTGLHGANRLASNSLLECLVTAHFCAQEIKDQNQAVNFSMEHIENTEEEEEKKENLDPFLVNALWEEVRNLMWNYVGIQRSTQRLQFALEKIKVIEHLTKNWTDKSLDRDATELINIVFFSKACILSAIKRSESRGCHFLQDHPEKESQVYTTVLYKDKVSTEPL